MAILDDQSSDTPTAMSVPSVTGAKLGASWGPGGNQVTVFPSSGSKNTQSGSVRSPAGGMPLTQVSWQREAFSPILRKLVNESSQVFLHLQKTLKEASSNGLWKF